jgi:hypothetical protein
MSTGLKIIRALLILLSLPGFFITLYAGAVFGSLLWAELYPDPNDIAHGMAMAHAFIPMLAWTILGLLYLLFLRVLWGAVKRLAQPKTLGISIE